MRFIKLPRPSQALLYALEFTAVAILAPFFLTGKAIDAIRQRPSARFLAAAGAMPVILATAAASTTNPLPWIMAMIAATATCTGLYEYHSERETLGARPVVGVPPPTVL